MAMKDMSDLALIGGAAAMMGLGCFLGGKVSGDDSDEKGVSFSAGEKSGALRTLRKCGVGNGVPVPRSCAPLREGDSAALTDASFWGCADAGARKVDPLMVRQLSVKFSGATSVPVSQTPTECRPSSPSYTQSFICAGAPPRSRRSARRMRAPSQPRTMATAR